MSVVEVLTWCPVTGANVYELLAANRGSRASLSIFRCCLDLVLAQSLVACGGLTISECWQGVCLEDVMLSDVLNRLMIITAND
jgi:hypothetical protein